ncbi:MAG: efflux transporter periplasmic adaptor subunit, partial [Deltaproteobacteria bacterium]|nr:efflux transporter periplasmic adaptor subunit [Deltaproteobacteria bacterium]
MQRFTKVLLPVIVVLLGAIAARAIIAGRSEPPKHAPPEIRPLVEVIPVIRSEHQYRVRAQGTVEPRTASALVAEVSARVVSVSDDFVEGGFFERGESLIQLDDRDYRAAVAAAEAEVAAAHLRLAQQEEEARVAQQEWARFQE